MKLILSPRYEALRPFILTLPRLMAQGEGTTIHDGRNLIKTFTAPGGLLLNVKRYQPPGLFLLTAPAQGTPRLSLRHPPPQPRRSHTRTRGLP